MPCELKMRVLYPAEDDPHTLSEEQLSLKIARHSPCSLCPCSGLRPPVGVEVSPDDSLLSDQMELAYLSECHCGHDVPSHGADVSVLGRPEYQRRGRVAVRIDEMLQVRRGCFDFHVGFLLNWMANLGAVCNQGSRKAPN